MFFGDRKTRQLRKIADAYRASTQAVFSGGGPLLTDVMEWNGPEILGPLFDLVEADQELARIMHQHDATRDDLNDLFTKLDNTIGPQRIRGHDVPFSTLAYPASLNFALREKDSLGYDQQDRLIDFFKRGRKGEV